MRDIIEKIVGGDDSKFEALIKKLVAGQMLAFAQVEDPEGLTINFLNYLLEENEDIEYVPLFSDAEEVNAFVEDADIPDGYTLYEFDGDLLADVFEGEQYLMINPVSGGIVFQAAHMKMFASPANDQDPE
ncbi:MAG: hypothetical protein DI626_04305 [Micavibrio aeruginosavorus]|uniref:Uncharacterized protein n=1 Tax=Micavibrio aeruginosavorus TaxID=349221 RepID=A0A2W5BW23_9BACT|nr:MAG: hypothetical protein DI626_04305 [Micavibrio aeruginosavorus]